MGWSMPFATVRTHRVSFFKTLVSLVVNGIAFSFLRLASGWETDSWLMDFITPPLPPIVDWCRLRLFTFLVVVSDVRWWMPLLASMVTVISSTFFARARHIRAKCCNFRFPRLFLLLDMCACLEEGWLHQWPCASETTGEASRAWVSMWIYIWNRTEIVRRRRYKHLSRRFIH